MVMIHGLGGQLGNFTHSLVDRLCKDFRIVAFDRPGSGYSTRSAKSPAGVRAQAETLAKAIRALNSTVPLVVGHSFGGAVALCYRTRSSRLRRRPRADLAGHIPCCPPMVFRGLAIRSPLLRRLFAWTLATPGALLARTWRQEVFAPEAPPGFRHEGRRSACPAARQLSLRHPWTWYGAGAQRRCGKDDVSAMPRSACPSAFSLGAATGARLAGAGRDDEADDPFARPRDRRRRPHAAGHPA